MTEADIICNRIQTPDGTVIVSRHRHDYVSYTDANGYTYAVDGGLDYLKRMAPPDGPAYKELTVWSDDPHDLIRETLVWVTRGKTGRGPAVETALKDMSSANIRAVLFNENTLRMSVRRAFEAELAFRGEPIEQRVNR